MRTYTLTQAKAIPVLQVYTLFYSIIYRTM